MLSHPLRLWREVLRVCKTVTRGKVVGSAAFIDVALLLMGNELMYYRVSFAGVLRVICLWDLILYVATFVTFLTFHHCIFQILFLPLT
jgi:hypothetical protein